MGAPNDPVGFLSTLLLTRILTTCCERANLIGPWAITGCKWDHGFDHITESSTGCKCVDHAFDPTTDTSTGCKWDHGFDPKQTQVQGVNGIKDLTPQQRV